MNKYIILVKSYYGRLRLGMIKEVEENALTLGNFGVRTFMYQPFIYPNQKEEFLNIITKEPCGNWVIHHDDDKVSALNRVLKYAGYYSKEDRFTSFSVDSEKGYEMISKNNIVPYIIFQHQNVTEKHTEGG